MKRFWRFLKVVGTEIDLLTIRIHWPCVSAYIKTSVCGVECHYSVYEHTKTKERRIAIHTGECPHNWGRLAVKPTKGRKPEAWPYKYFNYHTETLPEGYRWF